MKIIFSFLILFISITTYSQKNNVESLMNDKLLKSNFLKIVLVKKILLQANNNSYEQLVYILKKVNDKMTQKELSDLLNLTENSTFFNELNDIFNNFNILKSNYGDLMTTENLELALSNMARQAPAEFELSDGEGKEVVVFGVVLNVLLKLLLC